jgi:predicted tellurium resistance membrane protein TerC
MRAANKDKNQNKIERALITAGAQFIDTSMLKKDTFDLIVLFRGNVFLLEIKNDDYLPKSFYEMTDKEKRDYLIQKKLTENEKKTLKKCVLTNNILHIVYDVDSTLKAIGAIKQS